MPFFVKEDSVIWGDIYSVLLPPGSLSVSPVEVPTLLKVQLQHHILWNAFLMLPSVMSPCCSHTLQWAGFILIMVVTCVCQFPLLELLEGRRHISLISVVSGTVSTDWYMGTSRQYCESEKYGVLEWFRAIPNFALHFFFSVPNRAPDCLTNVCWSGVQLRSSIYRINCRAQRGRKTSTQIQK